MVEEYKNPAVTVDSLILRMHKNNLEVLTIKRDSEPFIKMPPLLGGFVKYGETIDEALIRILRDKANFCFQDNMQSIILPIVSDDKNDVRGWIFTVPVIVMTKDFDPTDSNLVWYPVRLDELGKLKFSENLAFDHNHVLEVSLNHLRNRLLLHNYQVLQPLLSDLFTSRDLYTAVYNLTGQERTLSNFMRETAVKKAIVSTGKRAIAKTGGPSGQPSLLYKWR